MIIAPESPISAAAPHNPRRPRGAPHIAVAPVLPAILALAVARTSVVGHVAIAIAAV